MDDYQNLKHDVNTAEKLDQEIQNQFVSIEDIMGTMEAVQQENDELEPMQRLSDHQQAMVDTYHSVAKAHKSHIYAVADKEALEGFFDMTVGLAKKAVVAFGNEIPEYFKTTAKGLNHYVDMGDKLHQRLVNLMPLLEKRDFPYRDVFEFGSYSRFFQVAGHSITGFDEFQEAMNIQSKASQCVFAASQSYAAPIMEKLLEAVQKLQLNQAPDEQKIVAMRDAVKFSWELTWQDADIVKLPGQTPQSAINAFPERKFVCLAPLLDNRYLVAHQPKNDGGENPIKITASIQHYGASVVFDKTKTSDRQSSMVVPNCDELIALAKQTIDTLYDLKGLRFTAKQNNDFAKEIGQAMKVITIALSSKKLEDPQVYGFVAEYFKLSRAVCQMIQQPYVAMAWLYVRCAMVVVALVEMAVLEESHEQSVMNRFFTKQQSEFSNPALESYKTTKRVLKVARSSSVSS